MSNSYHDMEEIEARLLTGSRHSVSVFSNVQDQKDKGRETAGRCPFCQKAGHFYFSNIKPVWHCFHCQQVGNWFQYLEQVNGWSFPEALQYLAKEAGVTLKGEGWQKRQQEYQARETRGALLDEAQAYFTACLQQPAGERVLQYLTGARGYSPAIIQDMELGAYTDRRGLLSHLAERGYTEQQVREAGLLLELKGKGAAALGSTHTLSMLWRDKAGRALGFAFRPAEDLSKEELKQKGWSKYLYTAGMDKSSSLLGLERWRREKAVVLVEGVMDAPLLAAYGIPAGALGGTGLSREQIRQLEMSGVEEVVLALDRDEDGQQATEKAISAIRADSAIRPYVLMLSEHKDPDEYIKARGIEAFKQELEQPRRWQQWLIEHIYYHKHDVFAGGEPAQDRALHECLQKYVSIQDKLEARQWREALSETSGLSREELEDRLRLYQQRSQEHQRQEMAERLVREAQGALKAGSISVLEQVLGDGLQELQQARGIQPPEPYTLSSFLGDIERMDAGLSTGYKTLSEAAVRIPHGAITIIAGRPGHGKTTLMLNLLLNMVRAYPERRFCFFSYEEARQWLTLKILMRLSGVELHKQQNLEAFLNYMKEKRQTHPRIEQAIQEFDTLTASGRLYLQDQSSQKLSAETLARLIPEIGKEMPLGCVLVDYIQKIPIEQSLKGVQRYLEIKRASELLLEQAVRLNVPVVMGAQLNRQMTNDQPRMEHLRESGDIEQDASLVLGLYNKAVEDIEAGQENTSAKVDLEMSVLKYRSGQAGRKFTLTFNRPVLTITD